MARVTLKQISELTGYSQATVSNVLNQKKEANEKTVKRIFEAARTLGYTSSKKMDTDISSCTTRTTVRTANTAPKDSQNPPSYRLSGLHNSTATAAAESAVGAS